MGEIQSRVLTWLNQEASEFWAPGGDLSRLNQVINAEYELAVCKLEQGRARAWSAVPEGGSTGVQTITTVPTQREYQVNEARRILDVRVQDSNQRYGPLNEVDYDNRDDSSRGGFYAFRSLTDGRFYIGFLVMPPAWGTVQVLYRPSLAPLAQTNDMPVQLPEEQHEILAYETTAFCSGVERFETGYVAAKLLEKRAMNMQSMGRIVQPYGARRY